MGKVIIDITMSLDGFVTAPNDGPGNGLGDNGRVLHQWAFDPSPDDLKLLTDDPDDPFGSGILGRRTFDIAGDAWGDNPPFAPGEIFILTHRPHETLQRGATTFIFHTGSPEAAMQRAQASAGGKNVGLMGASISQQYLRMGMVDEMEIHVANLLLGAGRPLFANIGARQIKLERIRVIPTPHATHIRYRVLK